MALASLLNGALEDEGMGGFENLAGGASPWIAGASALFGAIGSTSTPAGPSMAASNPVMAGMFDSSGWSMNFGGTQNATSAPANSVSPVTTTPGQSMSGASTGGIDSTLLIVAAVVALFMVLR